MSDVERITTTELREQLGPAVRVAIIESQKHNIGRQPAIVADAVLPFIERERVRVVEGLVATIKALPTTWRESGGDPRVHDPVPTVDLDDVLAVVEAAREDND